jgi:hypothetical protein
MRVLVSCDALLEVLDRGVALDALVQFALAEATKGEVLEGEICDKVDQLAVVGLEIGDTSIEVHAVDRVRDEAVIRAW